MRPLGEIGRARKALAVLEQLNDRVPGTAVDAGTRAVLEGWPGWGPLAKAMGPSAAAPWDQIGARLRWLLAPEAFEAGFRATATSFYTARPVATAMFELLAGLGFTGGRVLEPGCGHGRFMSETPPDLEIDWTGVERDPTSARIAKLLYPKATILEGCLTKVALPPAVFDAAVGNVPFADVPVPVDRRRRLSLHNYFLHRALEAVRPNGLVVVVTSRYTLDARDADQRQLLAERAEFVGALRLPSGAFASEGTDVVADILVLRRRLDSTDGEVGEWPEPTVLDGTPARISNWFIEHPELVLGDMTASGGLYGRDQLTVTLPPGRLRPRLAAAVRSLTAHATSAGLGYRPDPETEARTAVPAVRAAGKEGAFTLIEGRAHQISAGKALPVRTTAELAALVGLRDLTLELLALEADPDLPDDQLDPVRAACGAAYDAYVARWGPLNRCTISDGPPDPETGLPTAIRRRPAMGGFRADPDLVTVLAIERYDDATGTATKAPILAGRVNRRPARPDRVATPADAVAVCLDRHGHLELSTLAELLDVAAADVADVLDGVAYEDPETGDWVSADEYLSGNVAAKLAVAAAAADTRPRFAANVAALTRVQPTQLEPHEITVHLGAPWVPAGDIEAFVRDLLGVRATVTHEPVTATWTLEARGSVRDAAATVTWGTSRCSAFELIEAALNNAAPVVYDEIVDDDGRSRRVRNATETMLAGERLDAIGARFQAWVWEDPERTDRLATRYNELFASTVPRRFDGAHLTFPGLAAGFEPHPWQRDIAWRITASPAALCGFGMGAGKTAAMFMAAMTLRRLGLANRPMIVVPNHLLEQVARDGQALYPLARILLVTKDDLKGARRRGFAARVATGDWDAVVITHSQFTSLPTLAATEAAYLAERIAQFRQATMAGDTGPSNARAAKGLAKALDRLEQRHRELLAHRTDGGLCFEQLGVDYVMVDEAHYFKNLATPTRSTMTLPASKRAEDLALKLWWLRARNHGTRWGALFTGTPVSNTLAELFVMQRYIQPDRLTELGLDLFDAWAGQFIEFETAVEVAPDGSGFRTHRRPRRFHNVPDLRRILAEAADIRDRHALGLAGPATTHHTIATPPSAEVEAFLASLVARADAIRAGAVDRHDDCMLKVCTDGRLAALDPALVGHRSGAATKIDAAVTAIAETYHRHRDRTYPDASGQPDPRPGALQIVFCDLGTPRPGDSQTYGKVRAGLANAGVPIEAIRFVHDARTDNAKAALFAACRSGDVSVLIASTSKAGVGTNIQARACAVHHLDAPWMPAEVDQREARAVRPGNHHPHVDIYRYVTERSFDAYMWQAIARKAAFVAQILAGNITDRTVDDIGPLVLTATEAMAAASGNATVVAHAEAVAAVTRLRHLATAHRRDQRRLRGEADQRRADAVTTRAAAAHLHDIAATATERPAFAPRWGDPVTDTRRVPAALAETVLEGWKHRSGPRFIGTYRDIGVSVTPIRGWRVDTITLTAHTRAHYRDPLTVIQIDPARLTKPSGRRAVTNALDDLFDTATARAEHLAGVADDLDYAAHKAEALLGAPFAQADELAAAETLVHELETTMAADATSHATALSAPAPSKAA